MKSIYELEKKRERIENDEYRLVQSKKNFKFVMSAVSSIAFLIIWFGALVITKNFNFLTFIVGGIVIACLCILGSHKLGNRIYRDKEGKIKNVYSLWTRNLVLNESETKEDMNNAIYDK